jgi:hypothetical protein
MVELSQAGLSSHPGRTGRSTRAVTHIVGRVVIDDCVLLHLTVAEQLAASALRVRVW